MSGSRLKRLRRMEVLYWRLEVFAIDVPFIVKCVPAVVRYEIPKEYYTKRRWTDIDGCGLTRPTHWMPLPAPPADGAAPDTAKVRAPK